jgi:hypothetical protein
MNKTTVYQNMLVFRQVKKVAPMPNGPTRKAPQPITLPKSGEERLTEQELLAKPKPISTPKPPSPDVAAE